MKKQLSIVITVMMVATMLAGCGTAYDNAQKGASKNTTAVNEEYKENLNFSDTKEYEFATKGLIDAPEAMEITDSTGKVLFSQSALTYLADGAEIPDTINPSLWRNGNLNNQYGLFKVADGVYQVRGYDLSNMGFIEGETGWIVIDPLTSTELSQAAMQLVEKNLGKRPVSAIVISHCHADHYGGIRGIVSDEDIISGKVPIFAPAGFVDGALGEMLIAGNAMGRRSDYQFGLKLDNDPQGNANAGHGIAPKAGTVSFIPPTQIISETGTTKTIDGVEFEFMMAQGTEAPSEMVWYMPQSKALFMSEICNATLHNLGTLRGAAVRDGNAWAKSVFEAQQRYGDKAEVVLTCHNYPRWGNEEVNNYLLNTAAVYKYINDQTLNYVNQGYTPNEIAELIKLPDALDELWYLRPYYGSVEQNAKAVYQKYIGWFDGNPVNLDPLAPVDEAKMMVEYMGGADAIMKKASSDFAAGEYQQVIQVTNYIVFTDPSNQQARYLCADALEQLGYQQENGVWRNEYLTGAIELRNDMVSTEKAAGSPDLVKNMTSEMMLDYLGVIIDGEKSADKDIKLKLNITDTGEKFFVHMKNGALLYSKGETDQDADATLTMPRMGFTAIMSKNAELQQKMIQVDGKQDVIADLTEHVTAFDRDFKIMEP